MSQLRDRPATSSKHRGEVAHYWPPVPLKDGESRFLQIEKETDKSLDWANVEPMDEDEQDNQQAISLLEHSTEGDKELDIPKEQRTKIISTYRAETFTKSSTEIKQAIKERFKQLKRTDRGLGEDKQVSSDPDTSSDDDTDYSPVLHDCVQVPRSGGWQEPLQSAFAETNRELKIRYDQMTSRIRLQEHLENEIHADKPTTIRSETTLLAPPLRSCRQKLNSAWLHQMLRSLSRHMEGI